MALSMIRASGVVLAQILHDTYSVWGSGLSFDAYEKFHAGRRRTAWGAAHVEPVVLMDGSRPLASAFRYDLAARFDGRIRRMVGVGSLFTPRELRGRGAASALMSHLVDSANTHGYEYVLLFADARPSLFERFGFVPLPLEQCDLVVHRHAGAPAMLVRSGDDHDIAHIAELNLTRAASARLALDRTEDFIRCAITRHRLLAGLGPRGHRHTEFLVAEEGHMAVAYLVCTAQHGTWTIEEAGDRDPSGARVGAMLQVMLAREPSLPSPRIVSWWQGSLRPPQVEIADVRPTADVLMIRSLRDRTLPMPPLLASDIVYWHGDRF